MSRNHKTTKRKKGGRGGGQGGRRKKTGIPEKKKTVCARAGARERKNNNVEKMENKIGKYKWPGGGRREEARAPRVGASKQLTMKNRRSASICSTVKNSSSSTPENKRKKAWMRIRRREGNKSSIVVPTSSTLALPEKKVKELLEKNKRNGRESAPPERFLGTSAGTHESHNNNYRVQYFQCPPPPGTSCKHGPLKTRSRDRANNLWDETQYGRLLAATKYSLQREHVVTNSFTHERFRGRQVKPRSSDKKKRGKSAAADAVAQKDSSGHDVLFKPGCRMPPPLLLHLIRTMHRVLLSLFWSDEWKCVARSITSVLMPLVY